MQLWYKVASNLTKSGYLDQMIYNRSFIKTMSVNAELKPVFKIVMSIRVKAPLDGKKSNLTFV